MVSHTSVLSEYELVDAITVCWKYPCSVRVEQGTRHYSETWACHIHCTSYPTKSVVAS